MKKKMKTFYVYILICVDNSYYTGRTNNIETRYSEHQEGFDPKSYTFKRRPVELVFVETYNNPKDAIAFEKQVKGWSRKKKEALIEGNWYKLKELSICKNSSNYKIHQKE